jgi:hypothetical protein
VRSIWKGTVTFGLVAIPVDLYAATEDKDVPLHQVHAADGGRIRYHRVCTLDDAEVPYDEIAKGFETDDGVVILTDEDFDSLPLSSAKTVEVVEFVPLESIDPVYFDKNYYLAPQQSALKPYVMLRDALHKSGQVAVSKIAIRQRESLGVRTGAIRRRLPRGTAEADRGEGRGRRGHRAAGACRRGRRGDLLAVGCLVRERGGLGRTQRQVAQVEQDEQVGWQQDPSGNQEVGEQGRATSQYALEEEVGFIVRPESVRGGTSTWTGTLSSGSS